MEGNIMLNIHIRELKSSDDSKIAELIRSTLREFHLDLPGTVYYDSGLDRLSSFYDALPAQRKYFVAADENDEAHGGVGIAEFSGITHCAELQKLYLMDDVKGRGLGKQLVHIAEEFAKHAGYQFLYLETHTNLTIAIRLYEALGFREIEKPDAVVHSTMNRFYIKELTWK